MEEKGLDFHFIANQDLFSGTNTVLHVLLKISQSIDQSHINTGHFWYF